MPSRPQRNVCSNCVRNLSDLRRCGGCAKTIYCSKECQRAHWKEHKPHCKRNADLTTMISRLGPAHGRCFKLLRKWSEAFGPSLSLAAASALDIMNNPRSIESFVLFVDLSFNGDTAKRPHTYTIVSAKRVSHDQLDTISPNSSVEQLDTPGMMQVLLRDQDFPWVYISPFFVPRGIDRVPRDPEWLLNLQRAVAPK
ncbi:hypothetical protein DFH09DRAFT_121009 [Mycena vulgaris]|nr:hypothetical protein DFH09DRAFT_121009 [Mycena vulgaris]